MLIGGALVGCSGAQDVSPQGAPASSPESGPHHGHHGGGHHGGHGAAHEHHFTDPAKFAAQWNSPERVQWQRPQDVIALMEISPGMTVADLGAGTGFFEPWLSEAVGAQGKVLALDVEDAMIKWLEESAQREGWANVEVHKAPYERPGVAEASLDRLLTVNVWHHIERREAYAAELFKVIKPGGVVVVVDYTREAEPGPPAHFRLDPEQIMAELKAGGFEVSQAQEELPRQYVIIARKPSN
jgi:ubiquinone/menaquinone biosynthesis C-methylase UbiE